MDLFERAMPEIEVEDIQKIYSTLVIGSKVRIEATICTASKEITKDVDAIVREVYPHHAMCEYNGHIFSVQLKDIAFKNRSLL